MATATLRPVGGSTVVAIPPALLQELGLAAHAKVEIRVEAGRIIIQPLARKSYRLDDLLAACDASAARTEDDDAWLAAPAAGREAL